MKSSRVLIPAILGFTLSTAGGFQAQTLQHFSPPPGNPFSPMNIFIIWARLDDLNLTPDDEVAVFDNNLCVGAALFTGQESITTPLVVNATKDDGGANGFTDGNPIIFKIWDTSAQHEKTLKPEELQFYDPATGDRIDPVPFSGLGTAAIAISAFTTSVPPAAADGAVVPDEYNLDQNYPNPFNPSTTICYALPEATHIRLDVFDVQGNLVTTLCNGQQPAGYFSIEWDGTNISSERIASGIYFLRLTSRQMTVTRKMIFSK